jgi:hypothetical protein
LVVPPLPSFFTVAVNVVFAPRVTVEGAVVNETAGSATEPRVNETFKLVELLEVNVSLAFATEEVKDWVVTELLPMPVPTSALKVMLGKAAPAASESARVHVKLDPTAGVPQVQPLALETLRFEI